MKKICVVFAFFLAVQGSFAQGIFQWNKIPQSSDSNVRSGGFMFTIGNKIYYGGGEQAYQTGSYAVYKDFYEYDVGLSTWSRKNDIPIYNDYATSFSIDGKGYIGPGGIYQQMFHPDNVFNQLWQYD